MSEALILLLGLPGLGLILFLAYRDATRDPVGEALAGIIAKSRVENLDISKTSICTGVFVSGNDVIQVSWYPWATAWSLRYVSLNGIDAPATGPGQRAIMRAVLKIADAEFKRRAADIVARAGVADRAGG